MLDRAFIWTNKLRLMLGNIYWNGAIVWNWVHLNASLLQSFRMQISLLKTSENQSLIRDFDASHIFCFSGQMSNCQNVTGLIVRQLKTNCVHLIGCAAIKRIHWHIEIKFTVLKLWFEISELVNMQISQVEFTKVWINVAWTLYVCIYADVRTCMHTHVSIIHMHVCVYICS